MPSTTETVDQVKGAYRNMTGRQKIASAIAIAIVLAGFAGIVLLANHPSYRTLYSDLSPEGASEVVEWLKKEKIPCQLTQGGTTIQVPEERLYEVRLALAGAGLPKGAGVGFEVFDKTNLGATDFVQQVNYQRALQGELERTIAQFPQVQTARVHLAQPKESLFVTERREPTASVVLKLKQGERLDLSQVRGIVHMVASAVPRLRKENVSVVDTTGELLSEQKEAAEEDLGSMTAAQLAYQRRLEDHYKNKIQGMLDGVLGSAKAVARVSAQLDFDQVQVSEDRFDPETVAVRSEQRLVETAQDGEEGGVPGVKGGLADKLQGNVDQPATAAVRQRRQDTTNYEITRLQRQVNEAVGKLERLSVGVIVDGTYKDGEKDAAKVYVPRTDDEMANLERIVKAAMGFSEERGDELSVVNVAFSEQAPLADGAGEAVDRWAKLGRPALNLILALLFLLFVVRPLLKRYVMRPEGKMEPFPQREAGGPAGLEGQRLERLPEPAPLEPLPNPQEELRELAKAYPERAAALIKVWLRDKEQDGSART